MGLFYDPAGSDSLRSPVAGPRPTRRGVRARRAPHPAGYALEVSCAADGDAPTGSQPATGRAGGAPWTLVVRGPRGDTRRRFPTPRGMPPSPVPHLNRVDALRVYMSKLGELDDGDLVRRARRGETEAYGALVERYMRAAYSVALSVTRRHEDAEDAAQESLMVALDRLDECRSPDRFAGWLMTIVRNRSRNLVRRESLRDADPVPESASHRGPRPDRVTERSELREQLDEALGGLPEIQREIVLLHDLEGWKHREIAERLGIPSGTVRSHLHFARKALRAVLGPEDDGENARDAIP